MTSKGICSKCKQHRWISRQGLCKPCGYDYGECANCRKERKIYVRGLCYCCYQDEQVSTALAKQLKHFAPASEYNRYIFDLYLKYIKRYRLSYFHLEQSTKLITILEKTSITPLKRWPEVISLSKKLKLVHNNTKKNGCAILKIGRMLQELGVLPPRETDREGILINSFSLLEGFADNLLFKEYVQDLLRTGRSYITASHALKELRRLSTWLNSNHYNQASLLTSESQLMQFLESFQDKKYQIRRTYCSLNQFYNWCVSNKKIAFNPIKNIAISRPAAKLTICSNEQIKMLRNYIVAKSSNPEHAFLLALILFFGLTTENIANATIEMIDGEISIALYRRKRTKGRQYFNREEVLKLPRSPKWFAELQQRFIEKWGNHYQKVVKTYPLTPLCLPYHNRYNRFVTTTSIVKRVYRATKEACGEKIPQNILRQTCGAIYSQNGDGDALTRLGWSRQFAFHYTWLPRNYFISSK